MPRTLARWIREDEVATGDRGWAFNLAVFRIVFLGAAVMPFAWRTLRWTASVMPGLPRDAWAPVSFFAWLPPDLLTDARLAWRLALANLVLVLLALVGVRTRTTLGAATVLSLYVFGLMENTGKVDHYHHMIWFMALLAVGPSARLLSVDALLGGRRGAPVPAGDALVTLRAVWILFGLVYLGPGVAKLASAVGEGWASPDHLRLIVWWQWFARSLYQPGFTPARWVDSLPSWLVGAGGLAVIAFEIGFAFLVLFRRARHGLVAAGLLFHLVNGVVLGIWFAFLIPAYVALVDWAAIGRRFGVADESPARAVAPPAGVRWVLVVAAVLIAAQAGTSAGRILRPQWAGPVWPFDLYPTFASRRAPETALWEPRALLDDGRERRLGAHAWARAFGSAARCRQVAEGILREPDTARRRARSRDVAALLWRHEAPEMPSAAVAVTVYEVRYALASVPRPIGETLLFRFALDELAPSPGAPARSHGAEAPSAP